MQVAYCRVQSVPFCCGAREVGSMGIRNVDESQSETHYRRAGYIVASGVSKKEAAEKLLKVLESQAHMSLQFWFKRQHNGGYDSTLTSMKEKQYQKEFVAQELMDAVIEAGGLEMARYLNPNTKNELYGIILTTNCVSLKE